jgi:hypothetical protein
MTSSLDPVAKFALSVHPARGCWPTCSRTMAAPKERFELAPHDGGRIEPQAIEPGRRQVSCLTVRLPDCDQTLCQ